MAKEAIKPLTVMIEVPAERIADLLTTAIESGDPVTTAARGGWCDGIDFRRAKGQSDPGGRWYSHAATFAGQFFFIVVEVDDESTGHKTTHTVNRARVATGLAIMAAKYSDAFGQIMGDNIDAPCADLFLQCVLFGEEKYA